MNQPGRNCKADKTFRKLGLAFAINHVNSLVDTLDQENPVYSYLTSYLVSVTEGLSSKYTFLYIYKNIMDSDNGWLLSDNVITDFYTSSYDEDVNLVGEELNRFEFRLDISTKNLAKVYKRTYMKLQDLLAKIGGIINASVIIVYSISYIYLRYLFLLFIRINSFGEIKNSEDNYNPQNINSILNSVNNNSFSKSEVKIPQILKLNNFVNKNYLKDENEIQNERDERNEKNERNERSNRESNNDQNQSKDKLFNKAGTDKGLIGENQQKRNEFVNINEVKFFKYLCYEYMPCCNKKEVKAKYEFEFERIKELINVKKFYKLLAKLYDNNWIFNK